MGRPTSRRPVTLRPLQTVGDIGARRWCAWLNNPETRRYLESRGTWTQERLWIWFAGHVMARGTRLYVICVGARPVGTLKLEGVGPGMWANLGLMIGVRSARGRGVGTAAITRACTIARRAGCQGVWAGMPKAHRASRRAFERAGFVEAPPYRLGFGPWPRRAGRMMVLRRLAP